jgi:hypothetical protein
MKQAITILMLLSTIITLAQKGNNNIGIAAEVGVPFGVFEQYNKLGVGGSVKGMLGIAKKGHITLTTGYTSFKVKGSTPETNAETNIIPILAGYRHNVHHFFIEPQLGFGLYESKTKSFNGTNSDIESQITWALGAGYLWHKLELGIRYQEGYKEGENTGLIGIHLGYNFLH